MSILDRLSDILQRSSPATIGLLRERLYPFVIGIAPVLTKTGGRERIRWDRVAWKLRGSR